MSSANTTIAGVSNVFIATLLLNACPTKNCESKPPTMCRRLSTWVDVEAADSAADQTAMADRTAMADHHQEPEGGRASAAENRDPRKACRADVDRGASYQDLAACRGD